MAKAVKKQQQAPVVVKGYVPALQKKYREEIVPRLMKEFGFTSVMQVPRLEKIVIIENDTKGPIPQGVMSFADLMQARKRA